MWRSMALSVIPCALLAACSSAPQGSKVASASVPEAVRPLPVRRAGRRKPPAPAVQSLPAGLEGIIGSTRADLVRQFGPARLDVWEGDARKLQYADAACVLDIFLYPAAEGREPQATYIEARRASDAREVDRLACVASLRHR